MCKEKMLNKNNELPRDFVVLDFETTGFSPATDHIIQIGAIKYINLTPISQFSTYIKPPVSIPKSVTNLTGINDSTVEFSPKISKVIKSLINFISDFSVVCHNAPFDMAFLTQNLHKQNIELPTNTVIDTLMLSRQIIKNIENYKLATLKNFLKLDEKSHDALSDCRTTGELYLYCYASKSSYDKQQIKDYFNSDLNQQTSKQITESSILPTETEKQYYNAVYKILKDFNCDLSEICCIRSNSCFMIMDTYLIMRFKFASKSTYWLTETSIEDIQKISSPNIVCAPATKAEGSRNIRVYLNSPNDLYQFKSLIKRQYDECQKMKKNYFKYYKNPRHFDGEFKIKFEE